MQLGFGFNGHPAKIIAEGPVAVGPPVVAIEGGRGERLAGDRSRNWLKNGITQTQEGKAFRLENEWLAGDRGGWDAQINND